MPDSESPTPWYLLFARRQVAEAIHAAQHGDGIVVIDLPGMPVTFTEKASTCLMALQACRRGKVHRHSIPAELRDHCACTGNRITWAFGTYNRILAEQGARLLVEHLARRHTNKLVAGRKGFASTGMIPV